MRKAAILAVVILALALGAESASAQSTEILKRGVVRVTNQLTKQRGTGFIVHMTENEVYIITAYHVVEGDGNPQIGFFTQQQPVVGTIKIQRPELDLAAIVVSGKDNFPSDLKVLEVSTSNLSGGDEVEVIGHPQGRPTWSVMKGNIEAVQAGLTVFSGNLGEGVSGGPLFRYGQVVGLVKEGGLSDRGISSRGVPAKIISGFLEGIIPRQPTRAELNLRKLLEQVRSEEFRSALKEIIRSSSSSFVSLKGPYQRTESDGEKVYLSTLALPGTIRNGEVSLYRRSGEDDYYTVSYTFLPLSKEVMPEKVFDEMVQIVTSILPVEWTTTDFLATGDFDRKFQASKGNRGPKISLTLMTGLILLYLRSR